MSTLLFGGIQYRNWLRQYATRLIALFNGPNLSRRTMALETSQPPTEMSTRDLPGGKGRQAHKADNYIAICELTV
jgi:hypothetical protein